MATTATESLFNLDDSSYEILDNISVKSLESPSPPVPSSSKVLAEDDAADGPQEDDWIIVPPKHIEVEEPVIKWVGLTKKATKPKPDGWNTGLLKAPCRLKNFVIKNGRVLTHTVSGTWQPEGICVNIDPNSIYYRHLYWHRVIVPADSSIGYVPSGSFECIEVQYPDKDVHEAAIRQLQSLGHSLEEVLQAYHACNWDLEAATELLSCIAKANSAPSRPLPSPPVQSPPTSEVYDYYLESKLEDLACTLTAVEVRNHIFLEPNKKEIIIEKFIHEIEDVELKHHLMDEPGALDEILRPRNGDLVVECDAPDANEHLVAELEDMGFSRSAARTALAEQGGDFDEALIALLADFPTAI